MRTNNILLQASVIHRTNRDGLRALCQDRGCYDRDNFTSYFRNSLFRELGEKGGDGPDVPPVEQGPRGGQGAPQGDGRRRAAWAWFRARPRPHAPFGACMRAYL